MCTGFSESAWFLEPSYLLKVPLLEEYAQKIRKYGLEMRALNTLLNKRRKQIQNVKSEEELKEVRHEMDTIELIDDWM